MSTTHDEQQNTPKGFKAPSAVMVLCLALAATTFATTLPEWISATVPTVLGDQTLSVTGKDASAAVTALAIVAVVGSVVLRISGPKVRLVIATLMAACGVGIAISAFGVVQNPAQAALSKTSSVTGTNDLSGTFDVSNWPWVAVFTAILLVFASVWAAIASRSWPNKRKYERHVVAESVEDMDEIDTWDSLSAGIDPTERH